MKAEENYININKKSWNSRTNVHYDSDFYDNKSFLKHTNSLNSIELDLLGDLKGKTVLHLQCHFGQDTISLSKLGAKATGVDFSDEAIKKANELAKTCEASTEFICCDVYSLPEFLDRKFDIVFTSYGTIGWLPDINKWATIVNQFLKPGGQFIMADFHPYVWFFDDDFKKISFSYFNDQAIIETEAGTYTDFEAPIKEKYISWNHGMSEILTSLLSLNLKLEKFQEFDYSPYNCFKNMVEISPKKYKMKGIEHRIPMVYAFKFKK